MKKFLLLAAAFVLSIQSFAYDPVNEKLIASFKASFPHAEEVNWMELPTAFAVSFKEDNILARAFFNKEGELIRLVRYYLEPQLPFAIVHKLKQQYKDKRIFGITEVTAGNADNTMATEYFVKLEDGRNWITVKVNTQGQAVITQKLRKS